MRQQRLGAAFISVLIVLMVIGCSAPAPATSVSSVIAPVSTPIVVTIRPRPTATAFVPDIEEIPTEVTPRTLEMSPVLPLFTEVPTPSDAFAQELSSKGYRQLFGGSLDGPKGHTYVAYGFRDQSLEPTDHDTDSLTPEVCRLAIYRADGAGTSSFLTSFGAPQFPLPSRYHGYPVACDLVNWDAPERGAGLAHIEESLHERLSIKGYSSDINANGLPEFAVVSWYCPNACDGNEGEIDFYEVQSTSRVVRLTGALPGAVHPWEVLWDGQPGTLTVQRVGLEYEPHLEIELSWIFAWNGERYANTTRQYAQLYLDRASGVEESLRQRYGKPFSLNARDEMNLLSILFLYESVGQSQTGYAVVQELTKAEHWPGTEQAGLCWFQVVRASAERDLSQGRDFELPISSEYLEIRASIDTEYLGQFEKDGYDISACKSDP